MILIVLGALVFILMGFIGYMTHDHHPPRDDRSPYDRNDYGERS